MMIRTPAVLLLAALACPSFAHAAEPAPSELLTDAARSKAEAGLALFQQARWSEAYENFRIAEELFHAPSLLMRISANPFHGYMIERIAADMVPAPQ